MEVTHGGGRVLVARTFLLAGRLWGVGGEHWAVPMSPDGVICSADGKQSNFPGRALAAF